MGKSIIETEKIPKIIMYTFGDTCHMNGHYLHNFTAAVEEKSVFFVINAAQIVHRIIGECLQIERNLSHNNCWAHQFFIGIL